MQCSAGERARFVRSALLLEAIISGLFGKLQQKFHCKCIDVGLEETGTSTFKCSDSTRRRSVSLNAAGDSATTANDILNAPKCESAAAQERLCISSSFVHVIDDMKSTHEILTAEIKCLRAETHSVRFEVPQLRKNVLNRIPLYRRHSRRLLPSPQSSQTRIHRRLTPPLCQHGCR